MAAFGKIGCWGWPSFANSGPGRPGPYFPETWELLEGLVASEQDELVLEWALRCLSWTPTPRALATLLKFARHPNATVRYVVAEGLLGCAPEVTDPAALEALFRFCRDEDEDVRWSAVYDLKEHLTLDTPGVREALTGCLTDPCPVVRELASEALTQRGVPNGT